MAGDSYKIQLFRYKSNSQLFHPALTAYIIHLIISQNHDQEHTKRHENKTNQPEEVKQYFCTKLYGHWRLKRLTTVAVPKQVFVEY